MEKCQDIKVSGRLGQVLHNVFSTQHCGQMFRKRRKSSKIEKDLTTLISTFT